MKPNKVGISLENAYVDVPFWGPYENPLQARSLHAPAAVRSPRSYPSAAGDPSWGAS